MSGLKGTITDSETGETLPNVGITLVGTYLSAVTNFNGDYYIPQVPSGDFSIKVQFIGYGTQVINGIRLEKGEIKILNVKLF